MCGEGRTWSQRGCARHPSEIAVGPQCPHLHSRWNEVSLTLPAAPQGDLPCRVPSHRLPHRASVRNLPPLAPSLSQGGPPAGPCSSLCSAGHLDTQNNNKVLMGGIDLLTARSLVSFLLLHPQCGTALTQVFSRRPSGPAPASWRGAQQHGGPSGPS